MTAAVATDADQAPLQAGAAGGTLVKGLRQILDLDDFERAVRPLLPYAIYGYVAHGSKTETTLRATRAAFDAWRLVTRVRSACRNGGRTSSFSAAVTTFRSGSHRWEAALWLPTKATR